MTTTQQTNSLVTLSLLLMIGTAGTSELGAAEANWPQWRGPNRTDVSSETGFLKSWPAAGPKLVWRVETCGRGYAGPAVVGNRLYTLGGRSGRDELLALDATTGNEVWSARVGDMLEHDRGDGPRSTPTVVGDRVFALSSKGDLICVKAASGERVWNVSFEEIGGTPPNWGYCESPLVDAGRVICTPGGGDGTVAAFSAANGDLLWRTEQLTDDAQYASPIAVDLNGTRQYIQLTMKTLVGLNPSDGKLLWKSEWPGQVAVVPTPIFHDRHVFITSGYGVGCKLVEIDDDYDVRDVYFNKNMKNHHGGVILVDGHLYGYSDGYGWICQNFESGEIVWSEKKKLGKGAIAYADGRLYCFAESDGTTVLIDASPAGWKERGRFKLPKDSELRQARWLIWTHPVVTGGRLYLRNQELLYCYDVAAK